MTTSERKWKRRQWVARNLERFKRQTGATWTQMSNFSGVYYAALRDYAEVRKELDEEHYKKIVYILNHKAEFEEFITPPEKFCKDCGISIGTHPNSCRCDACKARHRKEYGDRYREKQRELKKQNTPEKKAKARLTKKEKMMFKGMSENMRKISAIEFEARQRGLDYGKYLPLYNGGRI